MNQWEFLRKHNLLDATDEVKQAASIQYRKAYLKNYMAALRKNKKRTEILFTPKEYELIVTAAANYQLKPTTYIRESSLAYSDSKFLIHHSDQLEELLLQIKAINNNVNQIIYNTQIQKMVTDTTLRSIKSELQILQSQVIESLSNPTIIFQPSLITHL